MSRRAPQRQLIPILLLACVTAACTFSAFVGEYYQPDPGEIVFGSDLAPSNNMVVEPTSTAALEGQLAFVGSFPRYVTGTVRMQLVEGGSYLGDVGSFTFSTPGNFMFGRWQMADFPAGPGTYIVRMVLDSEVLAEGALNLEAPKE